MKTTSGTQQEPKNREVGICNICGKPILRGQVKRADRFKNGKPRKEKNGKVKYKHKDCNQP